MLLKSWQLLWFVTFLRASTLSAQHADPACPQQTRAEDPSQSDYQRVVDWTGMIHRHGPWRHVTVSNTDRDAVVILRNRQGHKLDELWVGYADSVMLRSLVERDSSLVVVFGTGGGGQLSWSAMQVVYVGACWLSLAYDGTIRMSQSGPDSFISRDTATNTFVAPDKIEIRGTRQDAIDDEASDSPTPLPETRCDYDEIWAWDAASTTFTRRTSRSTGPGCDSSEH
jgi:hypothetical protein